MAQQTINIGAAANDHTGDPIRDAFDKCNDNFTELYGVTNVLPETIRDTIGTALVSGAGITLTVNDPGDTITVATSITQYTDEMAQDAVATMIGAGTNTGLSVSYNDAGNAESIAIDTTAEAERIRDVIGAALVAGTNVTLTVNDPGDTITIAASAGGSSITAKDEGSTLTAAMTSIDFVGAGVVATNSSGAVTVTVSGGGGSGTSYEVGPVTAPAVAGFTQVNFGTSSATDGSGAIVFSPQLGTGAPRYLVKSSPAGSFSLYARIEIGVSSSAAGNAFLQSGAGIVLRNSANNEVVSWEFSEQRDTTAPYNKFFHASFRINGANSGTYGTTYLSARYDMHSWPWVRIGWDGTTATFYRSPDGKNWVTVGSANVSANLGTPDQIGIMARGETNSTAMAAIISYFSTTAPS
jgi:hypothetical protein